MAVTIHKIIADERHVTLRAEIAGKDDSPLLHALFQDVVNARLDLRQLLVPGPDSSEFVPFDFPSGASFELTYDAKSGGVSVALQQPLPEPAKWSRFKQD